MGIAMKEKDLKTLGGRIRSIRGDLKQVEFSDAMAIKQAMVSRYEANKETPSPRILLRMAQLNGTTMEWLLTGKETLCSDSKKSKPGAKAGRPLSREEIVEQAVKYLDQISLPETPAITAMLQEIYQDRELMKKVVLYYRFLTREERLRTK